MTAQVARHRDALGLVRSPIRTVEGHLYPGIGVLVSIDSISFLTANSALFSEPIRFPQFPRHARFWLLGWVEQWQPAGMVP
jgi:hypothetical protein